MLEFNGEAIPAGSILRLPAVWPYESIVDFMIFDPLVERKGMGLIVSSGYKGGRILLYFPIESAINRAISTRWLIDNWGDWVYPECKVEDVYVCDGYPVPNSLP